MKDKTIDVRWNDQRRRLPYADDSKQTLADWLADQGLALNTRCGGRGWCEGCRVSLQAGLVDQPEEKTTAPAEIRACQSRPSSAALTIEVPPRSQLAHRPQVCTQFALGVGSGAKPLLDLLPGSPDLGLAIDLGTTTVVVALLDLRTGQILSEAADFNRQIAFGDNVLTRIQRCQDQPEAVCRLRDAIRLETLVPLIRQVCQNAAVQKSRLGAMAIAGNTTMLHLFCGEDPTPMGRVPFTPRFLEHRVETIASLAWQPRDHPEDWLPAHLPVHLLPGFSAFVGADLVAGYYSSGMIYDDRPSVLIDIGTNGEILVRNNDRLLVAATAAGPAFEGSRLLHGCRAVAGAICSLRIEGPWPCLLQRIEGSRDCPGLCGTAMIDFLAEARRVGWLRGQGRFDLDKVPSHALDQAAFGHALTLHPDWPSARIGESDVAELLQAKAAVAAGLQTLLARLDLTPEDIGCLYLAGGFGLHLNLSNAIACGFLPGFRPDQIQLVGNASLGGAVLALLDETVLPELARTARSAEVVELNLDPGFEDRYLDALALP